MENKQSYSLCRKNDASRPRLIEIMKKFAAEYGATLIDRGAEAQAELSGMQNRGALRSTGGELTALTVERPNDLHISLSNLGLLEKFGMTVRYRKAEQQVPRITSLLAAVEQSWIVQPVDDGVGNDPPCKLAQ